MKMEVDTNIHNYLSSLIFLQSVSTASSDTSSIVTVMLGNYPDKM